MFAHLEDPDTSTHSWVLLHGDPDGEWTSTVAGTGLATADLVVLPDGLLLISSKMDGGARRLALSWTALP